jgi:PAS domain S-box-containing protein
MNLPGIVSLAGLLCYGWLTFIVARRRSRGNAMEQQLFLVYLAFMILWQCAGLGVSLAREEALAVRWYIVMTVVVLGQFVIYSAFVRAFFHIQGQKAVIWVGLALWGLSTLLVIVFRPDFVLSVYWTETTQFFLPEFGILAAIVGIPNYCFLVYAITLLFRRYRQAESALQRERIRYLLLGLSVVVLGTLFNFIPPLKAYPFDLLANVLNAMLIAYAILRYQLLDISLVIRKGLVYSVPTLTIGIGYFLLLSLTFNFIDVALGYQFFLLSLLLAAITALVVQPLRDKLQAAVDRLFFREKYDSGLMLQRLSRTAATMLDLDGLAVMIVDDIANTLHSSVVAFFVKQGETGQYLLRAHRGLEAAPEELFRLRRDHPVASWLLRHQTSLTRQQINTGPEFRGLWALEREALDAMQAELFVPLLVRDNLIGILALGPRLSELPYASGDRLTLTTLANQTAIAVENARLFSLEQVKVRVTSMLLDVARAVSSTLNLSELLQLIAQRAAEICGFDRCNIFLMDKGEDTLRLLASQYAVEGALAQRAQNEPSSHSPQGLEQIERSSLLMRVMQERRPVAVDRDAISKLPANWSETLNAKGVLIVPLISKGRAIGLMTLAHLESERRIGEDQMDLASTIASQAAVAIENVRLYQETVTEKERTATIVERALAGIVLVDPELRIISINRAAEAITGYGIRQAQGEALDLVFGSSITEDNGLLRHAMATGKPVGPAETILATAAGNRDVLLGVTPLPDGYLLSLSDVTPLKELNRLKTDIIANVSHEFRTPLAIIKGYTELLSDEVCGNDPVTRKDFLRVINNATDRLTGMVRDLLDISRLEAEQGSVVMEPVSIKDLLEDSIDFQSFPARERKIEVNLDMAPDLPILLGNADLLITLVQNLLSNAVKFSQNGGKVQVRARQVDGCIDLQITNQGMGISPEELPHLFEKFYRSSAVKKSGIQGTGLGLVLVKHAVDKHRGSVSVTSDPETGTCFRVRLPILDPREVFTDELPS